MPPKASVAAFEEMGIKKKQNNNINNNAEAFIP